VVLCCWPVLNHDTGEKHLWKGIQVILSPLEELHLSPLWNEFLPTPSLPDEERLNCKVRGVHKLLKVEGKHEVDVSGRVCVLSQSAESELR